MLCVRWGLSPAAGFGGPGVPVWCVSPPAAPASSARGTAFRCLSPRGLTAGRDTRLCRSSVPRGCGHLPWFPLGSEIPGAGGCVYTYRNQVCRRVLTLLSYSITLLLMAFFFFPRSSLLRLLTSDYCTPILTAGVRYVASVEQDLFLTGLVHFWKSSCVRIYRISLFPNGKK